MAVATDLAAALNAAIQGGYVAHLTEQTYTISSPIVVRVTKTTQGALGIDGGGATLVSQVTDGSPLIKFVVDPGVDLRYLTLSNFKIEGNGREGSGIQIVADGNDRWVYSWNIDNVTVENTGGYGLDVRGSVFEGLVSNSWMNGNALGGAYFGHGSNGGQASALHWFGGGFKDNGGAGLILGNGARDMSVDDAVFLDNHGVGVSAGSGITSVTGSHFQDNQGPGVWFQNYGNFDGNTFSTSGAQTVGISGYLAGGATLVDNVSTYTGPGPDTIALANLQGNGNAFVTGDDGPVITGAGVARYGSADGASADVLVSSAGVALPALPALTAATTAPVPSSTGTGVLETALRAAMANGQVAHLSDATYTVTTPIVINLTSSTGGPVGIDLGGAKIKSQITDGSPVIQIIVGPGVDLASLTLANFSIEGNGLEGDGLKIVANGADRRIHDLAITNVNVEHVGGIGLDVLGSVARGSVVNSWMHGNVQAGARFANSPGGGVVNDIEWVGGGFRKNGGAGLVLANGARDVTVQGAYFVENSGPGLHATSGITLVEDSGFENNQGAGAIVLGSANFANSSFSTGGPQTVGVAGYLAGGTITLTGLGIEYYGGGADPTVLANVQGVGILAATGRAEIVVGPNMTVTGGHPYSPPPSDATAPSFLSITASGAGISAGTGELGVWTTVTLAMAFNEAVIVTGGAPTLQLNDGGIATLVGGSGQSVLTFIHTVQPGQNAADLTVLSTSLNGAAIQDAAGNAANLSATANYNPNGILKIDTTSHVSIAAPPTALAEGNLASTAFTFVVTLSAPPTSSQTVTWAVAGSGANPTNGADFASGILPSGVLTFSAGETSKSVVVSVLGDTALEPSEGFALTLSNPSSGLKIDTPSANATILNDDAIVSVAEQSASKAEGNSGSTAFSFTVTRTGDTSGSATAIYVVTGSGSAPANAADFAGGVTPSGIVSFAAGETSKTIALNVAGDSVVEGSEGFTLTLSSPSSGLAIGTASATGTIENDDATLSVAALAAVKAEGNSGSTAFTFTVTRTGDTSGSATASYAVTGGGSAPANAADFTGGVLPSGIVSFAAGETAKTIALNVVGDSVVEGSEGFTLTLSSPSSGVAIGTASATGTIQNDDATLSVEALAAVKAEGNSGSTAFTFTVTRTGDTSGSATASYVVTGSGSAPANAADFTGGVLPSGIVSFAAGETSKTINVTVAGDSVVEASEGFTLTLSSPSSGLAIGTASATGTIQNDDATLSVAALAAVKAEGNSGSTAFTFTVTRTGDTSGSATASYAVTGSGSVPANAADFAGGALPSGSVSFAAGETSKTISPNVAGDSVVEDSEGFTLTLSSPSSGVSLGTASATGTIQNDDATLSVAALAAVTAEGNSGSTAFTFTVTRTGDTSGSATASYAVTGSGSAPATAADFTGGILPSGSVSFAAGETTKTITLNVAGDSVVEASEGFTLTLSSPSSGVLIGTGSATGTIQNDDATLSVAALAAVKAEGNSGGTAFTFTVTRTGDTSGGATASYAVTGSGSAPANAADFTGGILPSGIVSFAAGETTKTITLNVAGDTAVEGSEGFTLTLSSPSSGVALGAASATGTIQNDDAALSVSALSAVKAEGNSGNTAFTFTVTRTGDTTGSATASYVVTGSGSAPANAADFTGGVLPSGTVSFAAGETTKTITLNVAGDITVEATEAFTVTLSLPSAGTGGNTIGAASAAGSILNDDSAGATQLVKAVNVGGGQVTASNGVVFQADPGPTTGAAASRTFATTAAISGTIDDALYQDERWTPGGTYTYEVPVANGTYKVDLLLAEIYYGITGASQRVFDMAIEGQALPALQNIDIFAQVGANAAFTITQQVTVSDGSLSIQVGPGSSAAGNVENAKLNAFAVYAVSAPPPVTLSIAAADASPSSDPTIATASATGTIQNDDVAPPVTAHNDAYIVLQGQSLSVAAGVLLNDENAAGATPLGGPAHGTLNLSAGGAFSYTPATGYFGLDTFSYHAGNAGSTDDAQALLYVVPVSAGPTPTLNLTALSVEQLVAATYVAFFGRAADAGGFDFWVDEFLLGMSSQTSAGLFANVASSFGVSGEARALYPFLAHPFAASDSEIGSFLDTLYNNLFNRSADAAGLAYWTSQVRHTLAAGEFVGSVLIDVIGGAQNGGATQDITTLMSKVAVSLHFAREQQQHGTVWSGANDVADATALLDAVTSDPHTLLLGIRNADDLIALHG